MNQDHSPSRRELLERIRILSEENAYLAQRAEDVTLMRMVTEEISLTEDKLALLDKVLEGISTVYHIPCCSYTEFPADEPALWRGYCAFRIDDKPPGSQDELPPPTEKVFAEASFYQAKEIRQFKLLRYLTSSEQSMDEIYCIPGKLSAGTQVLFCFGASGDYLEDLQQRAGTLNQLVELIISRLDRLSLVEQIAAQNEALEERVADRTLSLKETNRLLSEAMEEQTKVAQALRESESRYRTLFEESPIALWEQDYSALKAPLDEIARKQLKHPKQYFTENLDLVRKLAAQVVITGVNEQSLVMLRAKRENVLGAQLDSVMRTDQLISFSGNLAALVKGELNYESESVIKSLDGKNHVHVILRTVIAPGYEDTWKKVFVSVQDITQLKMAEEALLESEARIRTLYDNVALGMYRVTVRGDILMANPALVRMLGYSSLEEINTLAVTARSFRPETEHSQWVNQLLDEGEIRGLESVWQRKDGSWFHVREHGRLVKDDSGEALYIEGTVEDVTEQYETRTNLQHRNEDITLINAVNSAINRGESLEEILRFFSQEGRRIFGAQGFLSFLLSDDRKQLVAQGWHFNSHILTKVEKVLGFKLPPLSLEMDSAPKYYKDLLKQGDYALLSTPKEILEVAQGWVESVAPVDTKRYKLYSKLLPKAIDLLRMYHSITFPLIKEGESFGLLSVTGENPFSESDIDRIRIIAEQLTLVIARRQADRRIQTLNQAIETSGEVVFMTDKDGIFTYVNPEFTALYGYTPEEVVMKMTPRILKSGDYDRDFYGQLWKQILAGERVSGSFTNRNREGQLIHFSGSISPIIDDDGEIEGFLAIQRDISEQKQAAQQIEASLREKEVLLREVHHRVKNNMQVISSLLNMQADSVRDDELTRHFAEARNRILSMSLVHERLYQADSFTQISLDDYVRSLALALYNSYGLDPGSVKLELKLESVGLDLNRAVPVGLILNELLTNALKYAFPENRQGQIVVTLRELDSDRLHLAVQDNGVGLPENIDFKATNSLGLRLVQMLGIDQLEGELEVSRENGTRIALNMAAKA